MTDSEWIANIHNFSNAEIFEQLEQIGCDGYYRDIWSACIEELQRRVNLTSGDLISRETLKEAFDVAIFNDEDDYKKALRIIDNAPTVGAIPTELHEKIMDITTGELLECQSNLRPKGKWVRKEYRRFLPRDAEPYYNDDTYDEKTHSVIGTDIVCSECGASKHFYDKFCGNCGADMRKGKKENE